MIDHSLSILADRPECPGRLQRRRKTAKRMPHGRRQFGPCLCDDSDSYSGNRSFGSAVFPAFHVVLGGLRFEVGNHPAIRMQHCGDARFDHRGRGMRLTDG
jgi:hypothetical protein